ncbi:MAG: 2-oxoacid:acceptor oxidoreductase family protein [candidate division WOR-3 bacterium]|uniref:Pyruvate synthase n=1 Tax=candidate division WOR-3 bacterium TaxID=2052148 RepID=A0A7V3ZTL9_UNCW3
MDKKIEIRWHGRGGMGAKTAALLLAEAMMHEGKYVQAFPEYGPERRGAPVVAFTRISEEEIKGHYGITSPNVVVILDDTLLTSPRVKEGVMKDTIVVVNTSLSQQEAKDKLGLDCDVRVVNVSLIAQEVLGRDLPNTPMLGALMKILNIIPFERFLKAVKERLRTKFREDVVEKNIEAIKKAYEEVK